MAVPYERIVVEDLNLGTGTVDVTMPAGGTAVGRQINAETFGPSGLIFPLGGSLLEAIRDSVQVDVINPIAIRLPAIDLSAFVLDLVLTTRTDDGGTAVTPVLYNVDDSAIVGEGAACVSTTDQANVFSISGANGTIPSGGQTLKLQVIPQNANAGVYCNGYLRLRMNVAQSVSFSAIPPPTPPTSGGDRIWPLGGSLTTGVIGAARTDVPDAITVDLPAGDLSGFTLEVVCTVRTDDAGTSVRAVLRNVTNAVDLGQAAAASTATVNTKVTFSIAGSVLGSAGVAMRLQLQPGNGSALIFGNGYARLYEN